MRRLLAGVALLALLSGCGVIVFEEPLPSPLRERSVSRPVSPPSPPRSRPAAPRPAEAARPRLPQGDPPAALNVIRRAVRGGAEEGDFSQDYPSVVNGAIEAADALRGRSDFTRAGKVYRLVLETYPRTPALAAQVKRSRETLQEDIRFCAERMMESGLAEYREGRMKSALALWQEILAFDPKNAGARRAVDTARRQLDALRTLD